MQRYEIAVLFHPDLEINLDKPLKSVEKLLKDAGAKVDDVNNWGKRKLAYPIENEEFAVYVFYTVELAPAAVNELETKLNLKDEIIRHLVVRVDEAALAAAEAAQAKKEQDAAEESDAAAEQEAVDEQDAKQDAAAEQDAKQDAADESAAKPAPKAAQRPPAK